MLQLQRTKYCFQISMLQIRFVATCQGTRISRLFATPFFIMPYQNLKKLSFTDKIVFSDKTPSLCLGVFTDIKSELGGMYIEIGQHFVSRTVDRATAN